MKLSIGKELTKAEAFGTIAHCLFFKVFKNVQKNKFYMYTTALLLKCDDFTKKFMLVEYY